MKLCNLLLTASFLLSGCSVYESDGRKYLEAGGLKFAKESGQITTYGCSNEPPKQVWAHFDQRDGTELYTRDSETYDLLVSTKTSVYCYFRFNSAREMYENSDSAVQTCLHQSPAACQGEFDFR